MLRLILATTLRLPPTAVEWDAPDACPGDDVVESRIAALVGEATVVTPATARVKQQGERFEVELVTWIDGGSQRRVLASTSCDALADAVAVVIAVALDPVETAEAPAVAQTTAAAAAEIERVVPIAPPRARAERAREPRAPLQIGLALGAGYGTGVARSGSALGHVGIELGRRAWAVIVDTRLWFPRSFGRASGEPGETRTLLGTVGLLGCGKGVLGRVELPVCAGAEIGGLRAVGIELDGARPITHTWVAPRVRLGVRVALGRRVGLWSAAEGAVPLRRAELTVGGSAPGTLWETPPASLRVMLGVDFRWVR